MNKAVKIVESKLEHVGCHLAELEKEKVKLYDAIKMVDVRMQPLLDDQYALRRALEIIEESKERLRTTKKITKAAESKQTPSAGLKTIVVDQKRKIVLPETRMSPELKKVADAMADILFKSSNPLTMKEIKVHLVKRGIKIKKYPPPVFNQIVSTKKFPFERIERKGTVPMYTIIKMIDRELLEGINDPKAEGTIPVIKEGDTSKKSSIRGMGSDSIPYLTNDPEPVHVATEE